MRLKLALSLEQLIGYCWPATVFALPLACTPLGADVCELPKYLILMTLVVLLSIFIFLHLVTAPREYTAADSPLLWIVLCCSLAAVAATVLSIGLQDSLAGTFGRHQGLLTVLGYMVLMLSAAIYLQSMKQLLLILRVLVWTSAPICFLGLLQFFGFNPFDWQTDGSSPVMATLGRSNFFGAYLVLLLPLTLMLLSLAGRRRSLLLLPAALQLVCLVLTHARSSWIGLGFAMMTWLFLYRISSSGRLSLPRFLPVLLLAALAWILIAFLAGPLGLEPPAGFTGVSEAIMARGGSAAARLTIWQRSVDLLLERPWSGYGFDTLVQVFTRAFPPELVYYQGRHVMVDRAHNIWLDLGLSSGLPGIITTASLFILVVLRVYRNLLSTEDPKQRLILIGLAAALAGHLADLQFSFDPTANAALFWLLLGLTLALARNFPAGGSNPVKLRTLHPGTVMLWLFLFFMFFSLWPLQVLQADRLYAKAARNERPLSDRIEDLEKAVQLQPRKILYHLALAELYMRNGDPDALEQNLQTAWQLRPNDPWIMVLRGHLYAGLQDVSPKYLNKAQSAYRQTLRLAPDISSFHTALAMTLIRQGRFFTALDELKEALRLDETDPAAYEQLALVYELLGYGLLARQARNRSEHWLEHERRKTAKD